MNWQRVVLTGLLLWAINPQTHANDIEPRTLCFFSLNTSKEFELTRSFLEEANNLGYTSIRTVEFHDPEQDANPETSFRAMLDSAQVCDGLVISGHHTGSFGGNRAKGVLNISFLEQLSCDAQYEDFFKQVKGVWLQGCRTLGIGPLGLELNNDEELQADYHTQRVGAELLQDGLEQSFADLSFEFTATLDQDNPLASRYLRVFPSANVFGWTKTSPGEKAKSEKSLLYHMAHMTHLSQQSPLFNPLREKSSRRKKSMSQSLWKVLGENSSYSSLAREAWLSHGRVKQSGLGFDNPDLNAYTPLFYSSEVNLLEAKALGCDVRNSVNFPQLQQALTRILSSETHVAYNLNVIWEAFREYAQQSPLEYDALRTQLVNSAALMTLLSTKLRSPQTGLLMKIEYYSFYKELTGRTVENVEALILDHVRYFLLAQDLAGNEYDIRDFRESLLVSVGRHQLTDTSFYKELIQAPEVENATLYALIWSFLKLSPHDAELIINDIINHPKAENDTLRVSAIWVITNGTSEKYSLLEKIVTHPKVEGATIETVALVLTKYDLQESDELVKKIVYHPRASSLALSRASLAVAKHDIDVHRGTLEDILAHPSVDRWGLQNVARATVKKGDIENSELLIKITNHEKVDANALSSVAIALGNQDIQGGTELLNLIRNHPRADARTQRYVDRAIAKNAPPEQEEEFF